MDELDRKIIEILRKNSRTSFKKIAKMLNITEGAVRYRVKSLIDRGIIRKFTIELGLEGLSSIVCVKTNEKADLAKLCKDILNINGVERVFEVTGEYDLIVFVRSTSTRDLNRVIDEIRVKNGVVTTISFFILQEHGD